MALPAVAGQKILAADVNQLRLDMLTAAQQAADATAALNTFTKPLDEQIDFGITRAESQGRLVAKFKPNTTYTTNAAVLNPTGDLVKALVPFTSGAAYNAADWTSPYARKSSTFPAGAPGIEMARLTAVDTHPGLPYKFDLGAGTFTGNGQTFYDPLAKVGFVRESGTIATNAIFFEADYWTSQGSGVWHHQSEQYAAFILADGPQRRPWGWAGHQDTGYVDFSINADRLALADQSDAANPVQAFVLNTKAARWRLRDNPNVLFGQGSAGTEWMLSHGMNWNAALGRYEQELGGQVAALVLGAAGAVDVYAFTGFHQAGTPVSRTARFTEFGLSLEAGSGRLFLGNGADPGSLPSNGGYLFVEAGVLKWRGSAGTTTTLGVA